MGQQMARIGHRNRNDIQNNKDAPGLLCSGGGRGNMLRRDTSHCRMELVKTHNQKQNNLTLLYPSKTPIAGGRRGGGTLIDNGWEAR